MVTLMQRANPGQAALFRMVDGAIRQAQHAHPKIIVSSRYRSSIAKRAAGLIAAATPGLVSEASRPPKAAPVEQPVGLAGGVRSAARTGRRAGAVESTDRSRLGPLRELRRQIERELWAVDDLAARKAYVHTLQLIAKLGVRRS